MKGSNCYLVNVKNAVYRNLRHYINSEMQQTSTFQEREGLKQDFLDGVVGYCDKLLLDPEEPKIRTRIRTRKRYYTRKGGDQ